MTVKQWLLIISICLVVYIAPQFLPEPAGAAKFSYLANWSLLSIFLITLVSFHKTALCVATVELAAIVINAVAFKTVGDSAYLFSQYVYAIDALALLQAIIILIGAPRDDLRRNFDDGRRVFEHIRVGDLFHRKVPSACRQNNISKNGV